MSDTESDYCVGEYEHPSTKILRRQQTSFHELKMEREAIPRITLY